jgi:hypothetical protein
MNEFLLLWHFRGELFWNKYAEIETKTIHPSIICLPYINSFQHILCSTDIYDEGCSRKVSCALNLIPTFLLVVLSFVTCAELIALHKVIYIYPYKILCIINFHISFTDESRTFKLIFHTTYLRYLQKKI